MPLAMPGHSMLRFILGAVMLSMLIACTSVRKSLGVTTAVPPAANIAETSTEGLTAPDSNASTTYWPTAIVTSTPINVNFISEAEISSVLESLHPGICSTGNQALWTPSPEWAFRAPSLNLSALSNPPDPQHFWYEEIADNIDKSRRAFVACESLNCHDNLYVKDNESGQLYQVDFGSVLEWRPVQGLVWISRDILTFMQSSNPHAAFGYAINVKTKRYEYYGMLTDQIACPTPTP